MSAPAVDHAHTREAHRRRAAKARRLAETATGLGVVTCELRSTHPDVDVVRAGLLRAAGVPRASAETWALVLRLVDEHLMGLGAARCTWCGSPVASALTPTIPRLPVDPLPHPDGQLLATTGAPGVLALRWPHRGEVVPEHVTRWREHRLACQASPVVQQRGRRRRYCPACRYPLAAAHGPEVTVHPLCEES